MDDALLVVAATGAALLSAHTWLNGLLLRQPDVDAPAVEYLVSVLIPARNEAHRISPTVRSVLGQRDVKLEVIVLDDGSSDDTVAVVSEAAAGDHRVRIISGSDVGPGWLGKPWACQQLGQAASGQVLVFIDADVVLEPHAVVAAVDLLTRHRLSLVSPYPRQEALTVAERLAQPLLPWLWLTFLPVRLAERLRPASMAAANGQFLVVVAGAYRDIAGHGCVRDRVVEDVWLARAMKAAGHRAVVVDGTELATCRMYTGWSEVRDWYTKSLWAAMGSPASAAVVGALLTGLYVLPPVAAVAAVAGGLRGRRRQAALGLAGYLAGVAGRMISARRTGGSTIDAVAHPVSIGVLVCLLARSWRMKRLGRLAWKGRPVHG